MPKLKKNDPISKETTIASMVKKFKDPNRSTKAHEVIPQFITNFRELKKVFKPTDRPDSNLTEDEMLDTVRMPPEYINVLEEVYKLIKNDKTDIFKTFILINQEKIREYLMKDHPDYLLFLTFKDEVIKYIKSQIRDFSVRKYIEKYKRISDEMFKMLTEHKLAKEKTVTSESYRLGYMMLILIRFRYEAILSVC